MYQHTHIHPKETLVSTSVSTGSHSHFPTVLSITSDLPGVFIFWTWCDHASEPCPEPMRRPLGESEPWILIKHLQPSSLTIGEQCALTSVTPTAYLKKGHLIAWVFLDVRGHGSFAIGGKCWAENARGCSDWNSHVMAPHSADSACHVVIPIVALLWLLQMAWHEVTAPGYT